MAIKLFRSVLITAISRIDHIKSADPCASQLLITWVRAAGPQNLAGLAIRNFGHNLAGNTVTRARAHRTVRLTV